MINDVWQVAGEFVLDVVYPRRCSGCGTRGTWLCGDCRGAVAAFAAPLCPFCGIPAALAICRCDELPAAIDKVRSVGPYGGWVRGSVVQIKYHGEWARSAHLGMMLADAAGDLLPADALVPVPLHPSRRKQRGFNQTEKLAEALSCRIGIPVQSALLRSKRTVPQVRLDAERRQENVEGAFALAAGQGVAGKRLILVDDVITTGATLGACALVLRAGGAGAVSVLTVAREL